MSLLLLFGGVPVVEEGAEGAGGTGSPLGILLAITQLPVVTADPASTLSHGGNGGGLWEAYQTEILQRLTPKSEPREPWVPPAPKNRTLQRTPMPPIDPAASPEIAEARERQRMLNTKTISDLLRKTRR